jgi:cbb3-type cytochrome oxidase subunit 3
MTDHATVKALAIAHGEEGFESVRTVNVVPAPVVNRLLTWASIGLAVITIVSIAALAAFSIYRGQERHSFNHVVAVLNQELEDARLQRAGLRRELDKASRADVCRANAQLAEHQAEAKELVVLALQFATAIDRVPPAPDPAAVNKAAAELQAALNEQADAIKRC